MKVLVFHDNNCTVSNTVWRFWPRDGHALDEWVEGGLTCPQCGKGYNNKGPATTQYFYTMRTKFGLQFDFPTEAQWDFACRGGDGGEGPLYKVGNRTPTLDEIAWYAGNSVCTVHDLKNGVDVETPMMHPVGLKLPNNFGLYDMLGNVFEQCLDWAWRPANRDTVIVNDGLQKHMWQDLYKNSTQERLIRGGCFASGPGRCRVSARAYTASTNLNNGNLKEDDTSFCVSNPMGIGGTLGYRLWLPCEAVK